MSKFNTISSSTSMESIERLLPSLLLSEYSASNNNDDHQITTIAPNPTPDTSECEENDSKNSSIPGEISGGGNSSSTTGGDDLLWDSENGNWRQDEFNWKRKNKFPWDFDITYDDCYIKDFWTLKGITRSINHSTLSFEQTNEDNFKKALSNNENNDDEQKNYSILCSMCSCFLYSLAECFLG